MSELSRYYPSFYQPEASRATPEAMERQEAAELFNQVFDDVMLQHMSDVKTYDFPTDSWHALVVKRIWAEDKDFDFCLRDNGLSAEEGFSHKIDRELMICRIKDNRREDRLKYKLCADGVVRSEERFGVEQGLYVMPKADLINRLIAPAEIRELQNFLQSATIVG